MSERKWIATREGFGDEILELGRENPNIFVIDADLGKSCKTDAFRKAYPNQYVDVGIAEQNAAGIAAGLATCGKIPFVVTYAAFASMRMCEQIRQEICYPNLNVKIIGCHGGLTPAFDGGSHQAVEDIAIMSSLPNMTVLVPADYTSARELVFAASEIEGPVYIRLTRDAMPQIYDESIDFSIGEAIQLRKGKFMTLIATGDTVRLAMDAWQKLNEIGISARVIDMPTIKPIDAEAVKQCAYETKRILTIEDHSVRNGLGSAVCDVVAKLPFGLVDCIGIPDTFGQSGPYNDLMEHYGITVDNIVERAKNMFWEKI